ncbi:hypothetical protein LPJ64_002816 [Coemansia asiatica]|uniref:Cytochrome P450 n=1 Tax=Coemansia asiatica TaxID=1052880 RepID=A0A9W7XIY7_9FUNG|nr:hypothetical protein LPJ64_002816 [Coemansia asiatica]
MQASLIFLQSLTFSDVLTFIVPITISGIIYRGLSSPLRHLPGAWYTNFTDIERKYHAWRHQEHKYLMKQLDKYGGGIVRVGPQRVAVGEIAMFKKTMGPRMAKSKMYEDFAVVGENIFTTRNREFNRMRRGQMGKVFKHPSVVQMQQLVYEDGIDRLCLLFDSIISGQKKTVCNLYYAFAMMATDVVSSLAFGHAFGAMDLLFDKMGLDTEHRSFNGSGESSGKVMELTVGTMMLMVLTAELPLIRKVPRKVLPKGIKKLYSLCDALMEFATATVSGRRKLIENEKPVCGDNLDQGTRRHDILNALINAKDVDTGATMSNKEIASEITVLLAAGTDTTSNTIVSCIQLLLRHPQVYKRVKGEVRQTFADKGKTIKYEEAREQLPFLIATIYETMRYRATTSGGWPRDSPDQGVVLGEYFIPSGVVIHGSIGGVHMNRDTWEKPFEFNPDRFMGEQGEERKRNVVAFSSGTRICPGRHLAMLEMVLTLATVLRDYDFALIDPSEETREKPYFEQVDEVCHITTGFANPDKDCNVFISRA